MPLQNDVWSMYDYGAKVKIVYFKCRAVFRDKYEVYPLYPELDAFSGENRKYLEYAVHSTIHNAPVVSPNEVCAPKRKRPKSEKRGGTTEQSETRFAQSVSRARNRIFELAFCNEFQFFCTFTQSAEMRDRFNLDEFRKDLSQFIRNQNRGREKPIKYLLIPEPHLNSRDKKDIGAWHMHGLLMGLTADDLREFTLKDKIPLNLKNRIKSGEKVYNWEKYSKKFGYFTCTEIKSQEGCSKYLTKYITKDLAKSGIESGHHLFYASQGLKHREPIVKFSNDECPIKEWDFENEYVKVKWVSVP